MRLSARAPLLLAVLAYVLAGPVPAAQPRGPLASTAGPDVSVPLPDRRLDLSVSAMTPTATSGVVQVSVTVAITNTGSHGFSVRPEARDRG